MHNDDISQHNAIFIEKFDLKISDFFTSWSIHAQAIHALNGKYR